MKHLIIVLLFLPLISFAQETEEQIKKNNLVRMAYLF